MTWTARSLAAAAAIALVSLAASATDTSKSTKPPARKADAAKTSDAPVAFTNDDLAERYGPAPAHKPAPTPAAAEAKPPEPAPEGKKAEAPPAEIVAQREFLVAELERLRRREMSLRNPLLPREPPTDAEAAREEGMDNAERLAIVQAQIRTTAEQLAAIDARWGTIGRENPHAGRP